MLKPKTLRYRVNFGNGQVYDVARKAEAFRYIASLEQYAAFAFVEWQDPETGDWFRTGTNSPSDTGRKAEVLGTT